MRSLKTLKLATLVAVQAVLLAAHGVSAEEDDLGFSTSQTNRAVSAFSKGIAGCNAAPPVYRVDCIQQVYGSTVRVIANASAYWEAEVALTRVNRGLYQFVRANADKSLGKEKFGSYRTRAITEAALPQAQAIYADSVDKAVAVMRGGNTSEVKYFGPLADAVEGTRDGLQ
ncbi:MAG: hypothetical protein ACU0A6_10210 [Shimia sp.]|uniref:hypothetical protein n=1 Tax=Shimia sp. TaxID=1954381 RepID=UPI004059825E